MLPYTKYESSLPCGFGDEDFKKFSYIFQCKTFDPWGGTIFDPRGILSTIFLEDLQMFPYTKYESSRPCGFGEEDFNIYFNVKLLTPGVGPFLTPGRLFQQHVWRTSRYCHIPNMKALGFAVSEKKIFKVSLYISMLKLLTPGAGPILTPRG